MKKKINEENYISCDEKCIVMKKMYY